MAPFRVVDALVIREEVLDTVGNGEELLRADFNFYFVKFHGDRSANHLLDGVEDVNHFFDICGRNVAHFAIANGNGCGCCVFGACAVEKSLETVLYVANGAV